ncbi:MAG TPA: hypothetical protein VMJ10_05675, partial [Kofleriaceae bacterium]|nr:hypothetical protein [Kofleriaceae bacterium]
MDPLDLWHQMNILVKIITVGMIGMFVFMLYVIVERILTYMSASEQSIRYVQALGNYLRENNAAAALSAAK